MSSKTLKPRGANVLLERLETEETTKGGIIIPDTAKDKSTRCKVVALGEGGKNDSGTVIPLNDIEVGNVVLINKWGGTEVNVDGKDYLLVKETDIVAVEVAA